MAGMADKPLGIVAVFHVHRCMPGINASKRANRYAHADEQKRKQAGRQTIDEEGLQQGTLRVE